MRRYEAITLTHCTRGRGQPKLSWNEVIAGDLKSMGLTEDMAQDKKLCRVRIRIVVDR